MSPKKTLVLCFSGMLFFVLFFPFFFLIGGGRFFGLSEKARACIFTFMTSQLIGLLFLDDIEDRMDLLLMIGIFNFFVSIIIVSVIS